MQPPRHGARDQVYGLKETGTISPSVGPGTGYVLHRETQAKPALTAMAKEARVT